MGKILARQQNLIYNNLFTFMGTTATGYGSTLIGDTVSPGDIVEPDVWNQIGHDVIRCVIHQYGVNFDTPSPYDLDIGKILFANTATIVDDAGPDRLYTNVQLLSSTREKAHPSQLVTEPVFPETTGPTSWDSTWEANRWKEITYSNGYGTAISFTWFYPNQLNYFFNLGGNLNPSIVIDGTNPIEVAEWQILVNQINAVDFTKTEFLEASANPYKTLTRVFTRDKIPGSNYNKAAILKYIISGSVITFSVNFVAGFSQIKTKGDKVKGKWKIKVKPKKKGKKGSDVVVNLRIRADVLTTYSTDKTGGIQAPIPQPQLVGGFLSAPAAPISPFTFATGLQSDTRTITLRNNSTITCTVSDITLTGPDGGYDTGVLSTSTLVIPPHDNRTFSLYYTGDEPGYNRGYVYINSNVNPVVLFTEINIGGVTPNSWDATTTTNTVLTQDFVIDHAGGNYRNFEVSISGDAGFTCIPHPADNIYDSFEISFDPTGKPNGIYGTVATVVIHPLDISLGDIVAYIPIAITRDIRDEHLGSWISARGFMNEVIGFSYDWIGGVKYITVGVGVNSTISELATLNSFGSWDEVYRIEITGEATTYHTDGNIIKSQDFFDGNTFGYHFGVGTALKSVSTIDDDGLGNLTCFINTVRVQTGEPVIENTMISLTNAFYYYDELSNRVTQLEPIGEFTNFFIGFDNEGAVITRLVKPNLL